MKTTNTLQKIALCAALAIASIGISVSAQPLPQPLPVVSSVTLHGKPFQLSALRGKVVLLMFWSTDCAVCRDKMVELRQNYAGWHGKPFELVTISVDRSQQSLLDYDKLLTQMVPAKQRFIELWRNDNRHSDNLSTPARLPMTYLLDKTGNVVDQYPGRIPADAWDKIAELL